MKCCYVVKGWGKNPDGSVDYGSPPVQCGVRVGWQMVREADTNVRKYDAFCNTHKAVVAASDDADTFEAAL